MKDFVFDGAVVPVVTAEEMREGDRLMVEVYGVMLLQMMENAGRNLAILGRRLLWRPGNPSFWANTAGRTDPGQCCQLLLPNALQEPCLSHITTAEMQL